jgi:HEPN domain-containing protein
MSADPVGEWVKKAEDNYISALTLARRRRNPVPDVVCNQCQQCAEKYLKALLVRRAMTFPKTHDLIQLETLLAPVEPDIGLIHPALALLNPYGIDIRYPGIDSTVADSHEAVRAVKNVRKFARAKLGSR